MAVSPGQGPPAIGSAGRGPLTGQAPGQREIHRQNLGALLRHVHVHGATSRAELTNRLGLNRSTIGALTAELVTAGLIVEAAPGPTGRTGRPSFVLRPRSSGVYAYALSIEVDRLRAARVGLGGRILESRSAARTGGRQLLDSVGPLAVMLRDLRRSLPVDARCVGAGVAVSAVLRRADGGVAISPLGEAVGAALGSRIGTEIGLECAPVLGEVAQVAALAERTRGAAASLDDVIYLHGDAGVGGGILVGGGQLTGHGGYGGQAGHMVVNPVGRVCECGARGCWQTEIGERALLRHAGRGQSNGREAVLAVIDAAARGDRSARTAVRYVAGWLGFGVANLVNIFNPESVVFGGTLRALYLAGAARVRSQLDRIALPACRARLRLRTSLLGDDAPLLGAAELAFEQLLGDPLGTG